MTRLVDRLRPRRVATQLILVVGLSVVLIQIIVAASFVLIRPPELPSGGFVHVDALVRLLADQPVGDVRRARLEDMRASFPQLRLELRDAVPGFTVVERGSRTTPFGPMLDDVGTRIDEIRVGEADPSEPGGRRVAFRLPGPEWLVLDPRLPGRPPPPPFVLPLVAGIAFAVFSSVLLAVWAAHGLVRPLRALAAAAREFDIAGESRPLPDAGPEEVRVASRAFDAMRARIRTLVDDRTGMLAAMGHDLRTPITRLRLRAEFLADDAAKDEILRDLTAMNGMIEGALTYLREGRHSEAPILVDLAALVATVCDRAADLGHDVVYEGPDHLTRRLRPQAIDRAITNLVDNGVKHAAHVRVVLTADGEGSKIEVVDDGPGIAPADRAVMSKPFVRGDGSRNLDVAAGFGLGLAIVRAVAEGHGGRLVLDDAPGGGLSARIELPVAGSRAG